MTKSKSLPDAEFLNKFLTYNREDGLLRWSDYCLENFSRKRLIACQPINVGKGDDEKWYRRVMLEQRSMYAHRVIWKMVTGNEPIVVDHKDGDGLNNRSFNLRNGTQRQNLGNTKLFRTNSSGYRGVSRSQQKGEKWFAQISVNYKKHYLGTYDTPEEASQAYRDAYVKEFGSYAADVHLAGG